MGVRMSTYNGWANYPTWNVALWLGNDQGLYETSREMTEFARRTTDGDPTYSLANALKEWVREMGDLDEASCRSDLLGWAFDQVEWRDIATNLLSEFEDDDGE